MIQAGLCGEGELTQAGLCPESSQPVAHLAPLAGHQLGERVVDLHRTTDTALDRKCLCPNGQR